MPRISDARHAAFAILLSVERGAGHSDDLLRDNQSMASLTDADRRLATTLVLGVLRWQIQLDDAIRKSLSKPNTKLDPAVLIVLRMGAFQLLHLDRIPPHAILNEAVEQVKHSDFRSAAGLVNAVLRKLAGGANRTPPSAAHSESASALAAHPAWMVDRWEKFFGSLAACAICLHDQAPPATAIRLSSPAVEQELIDSGLTLSPGNLLTSARILQSGDLAAATAFREGRVRIQDEGSQLVAEIAAAAPANKILDCCAAPGGKTLVLADRNPAARILACEASPPRLEQLRHRLSPLGVRVECRLADATALPFDSEFDLALADVPCSGTGTLSRNPEIRHRLRPEDLPRQAERQRAILASALRAVAAGGRVVYSTCSLEPEENEDVIRAVINQGREARILPLASTLDTLRSRGVLTPSGAEGLQQCLTAEGFLRLIPGAFGTDGFFVAVLENLSPR